MKRLFCTLFVFWLSSQLCGAIQLHVCDANTLEPLDLTEVMVGMEVSILVQSDANDLWDGGVFIEGNDRAIGQLSARRSDPNTSVWDESCLSDAGDGAYILDWKDSNLWGFDCYTDDLTIQTGNWFVLDYTPLQTGDCVVGFYDHDSSWTQADPNLSLYLWNTPTRDLNDDDIVNMSDFALFAKEWNTSGDPNDPNTFSTADFSRDGYVGLADVTMFADFWLWGTSGWTAADASTDASTIETVTEPNIIYDVTYSLICDPNDEPFTDPNSLSDANSLSEVTLEVGDSVIIYIDKSSTYEEVYILDMDVTISDPNLGSIDDGELLVSPRMNAFDYVGSPEQGKGIGFFTANLSAMADGDMACFVYTATDTGTVTLDLTNYVTDPGANLEPMIIHQVIPVVEILEQAYAESTDLQESVSQEEWDEFIDSVKESEQSSNE